MEGHPLHPYNIHPNLAAYPSLGRPRQDCFLCFLLSPGSVFNQMVCEAPSVSFLVGLTAWKFGAEFAEFHLVQQKLIECLHTDCALPLSYTVIFSFPYHFLSIKTI